MVESGTPDNEGILVIVILSTAVRYERLVGMFCRFNKFQRPTREVRQSQDSEDRGRSYIQVAVH